MRMSKSEQETVILWNNETETANIWTYDRRIKARLAALAKTREDVKLLDQDDDGMVEYDIPKEAVKINPPTLTPKKMSDERRLALTEQLKAARAKRLKNR